MLPNSLTEVLPFPLVFSTRLPVLVCGTVTQLWLEAFLDGLGSVASALLQARRHSSAQAVFSPRSQRLQAWHRHFQPPANLPSHVTPSLITNLRSTGILTSYPSATLFSLTLGPTNPTRIDLPSETLDFSVNMVLTCFFATHADIRTSVDLQLSLRSVLTSYRTLPYRSVLADQTRSFGAALEPRWIFGARPLDQ